MVTIHITTINEPKSQQSQGRFKALKEIDQQSIEFLISKYQKQHESIDYFQVISSNLNQEASGKSLKTTDQNG